MIKKLLNIKYPIIQAPMLGVTSPEMVAISSNNDILGSLPIGGLSASSARELIRKTKQLTNKRFSVNLFANDLNAVKPNQNEYNNMKHFLNNSIVLPPDLLKLQQQQTTTATTTADTPPKLEFQSYHEHIDILLEEGIDIISFTFGLLDKETINKIKQHNPNSLLIGTATCLKEALLLQDSGIDIICAQGIEAGGHRGSFTDDGETIESLPQVPLLPLLNELVTQCSIPVIAAGAITNKKTIDSLLSMGAAGVQIGSLFITSNESIAIDSWKDALIQSNDTSTQLTRSFSGRWARGIKNEFMEIIHYQQKHNNLAIPPYPYQAELFKPLKTNSQKLNNNQFTLLWSGQQGYNAKKQSTKQIIDSLIN